MANLTWFFILLFYKLIDGNKVLEKVIVFCFDDILRFNFHKTQITLAREYVTVGEKVQKSYLDDLLSHKKIKDKHNYLMQRPTQCGDTSRPLKKFLLFFNFIFLNVINFKYYIF